MKLLKIYTSILKYAGLEPDDKGYVSTVMDDRKQPALINGARIVLPTNDQLRNFNPSEKIIFHPMTENILRGESDVIQNLKNTLNVKLNFTIGIVAQSLLDLVASPELHSRLSPEQAELLTSVKEADDKSVTNFTSVMMHGVKTKSNKLFTNIYLKRGGTHNGKRFSRVGIVSFPFYEELKLGKVDKIRVKDKETYKELFEFMLPGIDNQEDYNYGSNSQVAPYLDALMKTSANIASRLNDIIIIYRDFIDNPDVLMFDSDWIEYFDNLEELLPEIRRIPVQHGNDGGLNVCEEQPVVEKVVQQQVYQPPMQPGYTQQPYVQQEKPEIKETKRGLDWKSVVQSNPILAARPNPLTPILMQEQMRQQMMDQANRQPSWAQPQQQYPQQQQGYPQQQPMMQQQQGHPQQQPMMQQQYPQQQGYPQQQPMMQQYPQQGQPGYQQQPMMQQQPSWVQPQYPPQRNW